MLGDSGKLIQEVTSSIKWLVRTTARASMVARRTFHKLRLDTGSNPADLGKRFQEDRFAGRTARQEELIQGRRL